MRFMISVIDSESNSGTAEELTAIDAFNDRLVAEGHWITAGGLSSPTLAHVVDGRADAPVVTAGPLITSTEYVSGFWIIEAADEREALQLAADGSRACNRRVEVRAFL